MQSFSPTQSDPQAWGPWSESGRVGLSGEWHRHPRHVPVLPHLLSAGALQPGPSQKGGTEQVVLESPLCYIPLDFHWWSSLCTGAEISARPVAVSAGWRGKRVSGKLFLLPRSSISPRGWTHVWRLTAPSIWQEASLDMRTEGTKGKVAGVTATGNHLPLKFP